MDRFEEIERIRTRIGILEAEEQSLKARRGTISVGYHDPVSDQTYGSGDYLGDSNDEGRLGEISTELTQLRKRLAELERLQTAVMQKKGMNRPEVSAYSGIPRNHHGASPVFDAKTEERIAEKERLYQYRKVRRAYRKGGDRFDKFMDFITGQSPKWWKVRGYSKEKLEHLLSTYHGETKTTIASKQSIKRTNEMSAHKLTPDELNRSISDSHWRIFTRLLRNENLLKQDIKFERRR